MPTSLQIYSLNAVASRLHGSDDKSSVLGLVISMKKQRVPRDITGEKFNLLTAIRFSHKAGFTQYWLFRCDCGKERTISKSKAIIGETRSCGCYQRTKATIDSTTHGLTGHLLHGKWRDIINRCHNKNVQSYPTYGGRGVIVCDEWRNDFLSFYNWCINNGWKPGLQIDKDIKGNGLIYSPETCAFVTCKENNNNRRSNRYIIFDGEKKTIMQWSEKFNIHHATLTGRLDRGWTFEKAISVPVDKRRGQSNKRRQESSTLVNLQGLRKDIL